MQSNAQALLDRLSHFVALKQFDDAEAAWAARDSEGRVPVRLWDEAARVAEGLEDWAQAEQRWRASLEAAPDRLVSQGGLARALTAMGRWAEAMASINRVLEAEPGRIPMWALKAKCLWHLGDAQGSLQAAQRVLAHDANRWPMQEWVARSATKLQQPVLALSAWQVLQTRERFEPEASLSVLACHTQLGQHPQAFAVAQALLAQPKAPLRVAKGVLRAARRFGDHALAQTVVQRLRQAEPEAPQWALAEASVHLDKLEFARARECLAQPESLPVGRATLMTAMRATLGQADAPFLAAHVVHALLHAELVSAPGGGKQPAAALVEALVLLVGEGWGEALEMALHALQQQADNTTAAAWVPLLELGLCAARGQTLPLAASLNPVQGLMVARLLLQQGWPDVALQALDAVNLEAARQLWSVADVRWQVLVVRYGALIRLGQLDAALAVLQQAELEGEPREALSTRMADICLHGLKAPGLLVAWGEQAGPADAWRWAAPAAVQDHVLALAAVNVAEGGAGLADLLDEAQSRIALLPLSVDLVGTLAGLLQADGQHEAAAKAFNPLLQSVGARPWRLAALDAPWHQAGALAVLVDAPPAAPQAGAAPFVSVLLNAEGDDAAVAATLQAVLAQQGVALEVLLAHADEWPAAWPLTAQAAATDARVRTVAVPLWQGPGHARNQAVQQAQAPLLALAAPGQWWHPDLLAVQCATLQANPDWVAVRPRGLRVGPGLHLQFRPERPLQPGSFAALLWRRASLTAPLNSFNTQSQQADALWFQALQHALGPARLGDVVAPLVVMPPNPQLAWYGPVPEAARELAAARCGAGAAQ
ncbi:MAG: hypothetical protein CFE46_17740 [Burkholderiales bacterium PBB6]|nr:MAG: hypothetical protein CFE46_17740 [Burkholderiales bacterium PBB6]